ncbi:MAG: hypothetical protein IKL33_00840 [Alphaproteobacteria bacterium]|nr:hypothetical protein [Alphaproteobacteria bacterium]
MNKLEEKRALGFHMVRTNAHYPPVFLRCLAQVKKSSNPKKQSTSPFTIGRGRLGTKRFINGEWYNLWCMYGRNTDNDYCLFCKEENDPFAFQIIQGNFLFEFNAEAYATIAIYASKDNWNRFAANCVITDEKELDKFLDLIDGQIRSNSKIHKIKNFVNKLRKTL